MKRLMVGLVLLAIVVSSLAVVTTGVVSAQTGANQAHCSGTGFLGFPTWYKYLNPTMGANGCEVDFIVPDSIGPVLLAIFEMILRLAGMIAVGFVIFGGFQYMLSQGEPDRTKGARSTILNALIGLAIAISATAVVNVIANSIT